MDHRFITVVSVTSPNERFPLLRHTRPCLPTDCDAIATALDDAAGSIDVPNDNGHMVVGYACVGINVVAARILNALAGHPT